MSAGSVVRPFGSLSSVNEEEVRMLLNHLRLSDGFSLSLVWTPDEATSRALIEALRQRLPQPPVVLDAREWPEETRFLEWLLPAVPEAAAVCVLTGLVGVDFKRHPLRQLNTNRNYWMRAAPCHWVVLLPPYEQLRQRARDAGEDHFSLGHEMPDVYSVRCGDYVLERESGAAEPRSVDQRIVIGPSPATPDDVERALRQLGEMAAPVDRESAVHYVRAAFEELRPFLRNADAHQRSRIEPLLRVSAKLLPDSLASCLLATKAMFRSRSSDHASAKQLAERTLEHVERTLERKRISASALEDLTWSLDTLGEAWGDIDPTRLVADFRTLISETEQRLGHDTDLLATQLLDLGNQLYLRGYFSDAEPLCRRSLEIQQRIAGPNDPGVAMALNALGTIYAEQGRLSDAEPLHRRAIEIAEAALGIHHPNLATYLNNLALLYTNEGRYDEAEPLYRRAIDINENAVDGNRWILAGRLSNLALLCSAQNRQDEAESLLQRAVEIDERYRGLDHPDLAIHLFNLAQLYAERHAYSDALPLLARALEIDEAAFGPDHFEVAFDLECLSDVLQLTGRDAEAAAAAERAQSIRQKIAETEPTNHAE